VSVGVLFSPTILHELLASDLNASEDLFISSGGCNGNTPDSRVFAAARPDALIRPAMAPSSAGKITFGVLNSTMTFRYCVTNMMTFSDAVLLKHYGAKRHELRMYIRHL
jgi:hypothetical protein